MSDLMSQANGTPQSNGFTAHFDIHQEGPIDLGQFGIPGAAGTSMNKRGDLPAHRLAAR